MIFYRDSPLHLLYKISEGRGFMSLKVNEAAVKHAKKLIEEGKIITESSDFDGILQDFHFEEPTSTSHAPFRLASSK